MLTDKQKIKALEETVLALEIQMQFVIEMIGAPDANAYEKRLKKALAKSEKAFNVGIIKDYAKHYPS